VIDQRIAFPRLKEKLDDEPAVVSACVSVICELSRRNPKSYLPLAPQFFGLLTSAGHNWMLIKIVKLFAALTPLEPRLVKKLVPPLLETIQKTRAMSLMYECIQTVIDGGMVPALGTPEADTPIMKQLVAVCADKLRLLIDAEDQNRMQD
jgi:AP-3 complex subunit delta